MFFKYFGKTGSTASKCFTNITNVDWQINYQVKNIGEPSADSSNTPNVISFHEEDCENSMSFKNLKNICSGHTFMKTKALKEYDFLTNFVRHCYE